MSRVTVINVMAQVSVEDTVLASVKVLRPGVGPVSWQVNALLPDEVPEKKLQESREEADNGLV